MTRKGILPSLMVVCVVAAALWRLTAATTAAHAPPAATASPATPQVVEFHVGLETWGKKTQTWAIDLPPGTKLTRVSGQVVAAPLAGDRVTDGLVRQALVWCFPAGEPPAPPAGVSFSLKPPAAEANSQIDRHVFCVIAKSSAGVAAHVWFDRDFRQNPREVPGNKLFINAVFSAARADPARIAWRESKDPMDPPDAEVQIHIEGVVP